MSIVVDLIIILLLTFFIFLGYKRGLIGVAFKIFSFLIAVVLSFVLFKPITNYVVEHTQIDDSLQASIEQTIKGKDNTVDSEKIQNSPNVITNYINSAVESATNQAKANIAEAVSHDISVTIIQACVFIILFIVIKLLLFFLKGIFNTIANLPVIKQFNELGGTIYGILEGFLIIFILLGIVSLFIPYEPLRIAIHDSFIGNFLNNNNLLLMLLF